LSVFAQDKIPQILTKQLLCENKSVHFAHVVNLRSRQGTISDTSGVFSMPVLLNDTLRISAVGFYTKLLPVTDSLLSSLNMRIEIIKQIIQLQDVDIKGLSWKQFKKEIIEMELPFDPMQNYIANNFVDAQQRWMREPPPMTSGIVFTYTTNLGKQREKIRELEQIRQEEKVIERKFNMELIKKVSGLSGEKLEKFGKTCRFEHYWLLYSTEYEIIMRIKWKLKLFKN